MCFCFCGQRNDNAGGQKPEISRRKRKGGIPAKHYIIIIIVHCDVFGTGHMGERRVCALPAFIPRVRVSYGKRSMVAGFYSREPLRDAPRVWLLDQVSPDE
ncbi:MAG: hypothetical protein ABI347_09635 [Nitrososphaera sp.]